jgi:hypothetical protein
MIVQQAFVVYVRIQAKMKNDRTPIQLQNPLTSMLESQLDQQLGSGGDHTNTMVKNLASSFLRKESTNLEYDLGQIKGMQGGIVFNLVLMWFLHFKMEQVQPILLSTVNGFVQLFYNPLFQVYVLGRNLQRPFKTAGALQQQQVEEEETTAKAGGTGTTTASSGRGDEDDDDDSTELDGVEDGESGPTDEMDNDDDEDVDANDDEDEDEEEDNNGDSDDEVEQGETKEASVDDDGEGTAQDTGTNDDNDNDNDGDNDQKEATTAQATE